MSQHELIVPYVLAYMTRPSQNGSELLLSMRSASASFGAGQYAMVGGKIDTDESPTQALIREVREETGCEVLGDVSVCHVLYFKGHSRVCMALVFRVESWEGEPTNREPDKHEHIQWISLSALPSTLLPRHTFMIDAIQKGIPYAEWGFEG